MIEEIYVVHYIDEHGSLAIGAFSSRENAESFIFERIPKTHYYNPVSNGWVVTCTANDYCENEEKIDEEECFVDEWTIIYEIQRVKFFN